MTELPPPDDSSVTPPEPDDPTFEDPSLADAAREDSPLQDSTVEPAELDSVTEPTSDTETSVAEPSAVETGAAEPSAVETGAAEPAASDRLADEPVAAQAAPTPPPPPYVPGRPGSPPPVRRVYRSRHDRKVGGVSAGIAEYFSIDPTIVRLGMIAFIISGIGILVYIAAWIIVPVRPEGVPYYQPVNPAQNERNMTLAFGLAALALAFGIVTGSWEVLALALIGGGIWLLSEHSNVAATPATAGFGAPLAATGGPSYQAFSEPAYDFAPTAPQYGTTSSYPNADYPSTDYSSSGYDNTSYPPPAPYTPPVVKERKPQRVTWIVLSLLALLAAVGIAAATGDWWNVSATRFLGIGVIIIGIGVVVGQLRNGGARGLIPLGILCALALFPVSAVDGLIDDGVGESTFRPLAFDDVQDTYNHGIGKMTVDLSELDFTGRTESIDIELGIGELIVIVPEGAGGQAVLQAKAGEISHRLPNTTSSYAFEEGINIETGTIRLAGEEGTLDLNIDVGLGTAELRSQPSS